MVKKSFGSIVILALLIGVGLLIGAGISKLTNSQSEPSEPAGEVRLSLWMETNVVQAGSKMALTAKLSNQTSDYISANPSIGNSLYLIDGNSKRIYKVKSYNDPRWPVEHNLTPGSHWDIIPGETGTWTEDIEFEGGITPGNYDLQGQYCVTNADEKAHTILSDPFKLRIVK